MIQYSNLNLKSCISYREFRKEINNYWRINVEFVHISGEVEITLEGNDKMRFLKNSIKSPFIPSEKQIQKRITAIELSYSFEPKQNCALQSLREDFYTTRNGVIRRIPKSFEKHVIEDVIMLKYGNNDMVNGGLFGLAEKVGVSAYWNNSNLIICCSKKYEQIAKNIEELISSDKAKLEIRMTSWGPNLRIVSIV